MANPTNILETLQQYDKNRQAHLSAELNELDNAFVCVFNVPDNKKTVTIGLGNFSVASWGDGVIEEFAYGYNEVSHTYSTSGIYTATFEGLDIQTANASFKNCTQLIGIQIPSSARSLAGTAISGCTNLETIKFIGNNNPKYVGIQSLYNCRKIKEFIFPKGLTAITNQALQFCVALEKITFFNTTPPQLFNDAFDSTNDCPIYVPLESLNAYKTATNWVAYADRIKAIVDTSYLEERLPTAPTTDGTYVLKATVSSGTPLYEWVSES